MIMFYAFALNMLKSFAFIKKNLISFILVDGWRQYAPNLGREIGSALSALPEENRRIVD